MYILSNHLGRSTRVSSPNLPSVRFLERDPTRKPFSITPRVPFTRTLIHRESEPNV